MLFTQRSVKILKIEELQSFSCHVWVLPHLRQLQRMGESLSHASELAKIHLYTSKFLSV